MLGIGQNAVIRNVVELSASATGVGHFKTIGWDEPGQLGAPARGSILAVQLRRVRGRGCVAQHIFEEGNRISQCEPNAHIFSKSIKTDKDITLTLWPLTTLPSEWDVPLP